MMNLNIFKANAGVPVVQRNSLLVNELHPEDALRPVPGDASLARCEGPVFFLRVGVPQLDLFFFYLNKPSRHTPFFP